MNESIKKEELIEFVKQWIEMDTEINKLNKSITTIKKQIQTINKDKKKITEQLLVVIKAKNTDIVLGNNILAHKVKKTTKAITKKYLLEQLNLYYKNQPDIAKDISTQILNNREIIIIEDIILKASS
jgi:hypothetical protein